MNSSDLDRPALARIARKPYVAPKLKRLVAAEAKELLLRKTDLSDPEVKQMLRRIEALQKENT